MKALRKRLTRFDSNELPSRKIGPIYFFDVPGADYEGWECAEYYGSVRRFDTGFAIGGGPFVVIGITATDESARHDWREYQQIKNWIVGEDWEAVELYPAESRLVDPSNRFYLFCAPFGVFAFGLPGASRRVNGPDTAIAAQRAFSDK